MVAMLNVVQSKYIIKYNVHVIDLTSVKCKMLPVNWLQ